MILSSLIVNRKICTVMSLNRFVNLRKIPTNLFTAEAADIADNPRSMLRY